MNTKQLAVVGIVIGIIVILVVVWYYYFRTPNIKNLTNSHSTKIHEEESKKIDYLIDKILLKLNK